MAEVEGSGPGPPGRPRRPGDRRGPVPGRPDRQPRRGRGAAAASWSGRRRLPGAGGWPSSSAWPRGRPRRPLREGDEIELDPMTPHDRRIVHLALQEHPGVVTRSEGDEPQRRVIVEPAEEPPRADRPAPVFHVKQGARGRPAALLRPLRGDGRRRRPRPPRARWWRCSTHRRRAPEPHGHRRRGGRGGAAPGRQPGRPRRPGAARGAGRAWTWGAGPGSPALALAAARPDLARDPGGERGPQGRVAGQGVRAVP